MPSSLTNYGGDANHFYRYLFDWKNVYIHRLIYLFLIISFNVGPMHVIGFSTEFYYYIQYGYEQIRNQYEWLEQDLKVIDPNRD